MAANDVEYSPAEKAIAHRVRLERKQYLKDGKKVTLTEVWEKSCKPATTK